MYILNIALFQRSRYALKIINFILYDRSLTQENRKSLTKWYCRCYQCKLVVQETRYLILLATR